MTSENGTNLGHQLWELTEVALGLPELHYELPELGSLQNLVVGAKTPLYHIGLLLDMFKLTLQALPLDLESVDDLALVVDGLALGVDLLALLAHCELKTRAVGLVLCGVRL